MLVAAVATITIHHLSRDKVVGHPLIHSIQHRLDYIGTTTYMSDERVDTIQKELSILHTLYPDVHQCRYTMGQLQTDIRSLRESVINLSTILYDLTRDSRINNLSIL